MTIYLAEGASYVVDLDGRIPTLKQLQELVDGWIEAVPGSRAVTDGGIAYCNEEGRSRGLLRNPLASIRFRQLLVGDVVELTRDELDAIVAAAAAKV